MCMPSAISRFILVASVSAGIGAGGAHADDQAAVHFANGRALIEANCGDSYRPSRDALEHGIAEVESAVRLGGESAEAHRLLACAYNTLRSKFSVTSAERAAVAEKELVAVRRASQLDSRDVVSRLHVAALTKSEKEKKDAYEAILVIDPKHATALLASGEILLRQGRVVEGLARVERAGEVATPEDAAALGSEIVRVLREHGRERRAGELKIRLDKKAREARQ